MKTLIRESEWSREYDLNNGKAIVYESKILVDNLYVSPKEIARRWPTLSIREKTDFANAFSSQPPRNTDDQQILDFLLDVGPETIFPIISILLPFHPRRDRALEFLLDRLEQATQRRANYYQAAELLHASEALPILRKHHTEMKTLLATKQEEPDAISPWLDYLQCCKTLLALTQDPCFLADLRQGRTHAPEELRPFASALLEKTTTEP